MEHGLPAATHQERGITGCQIDRRPVPPEDARFGHGLRHDPPDCDCSKISHGHLKAREGIRGAMRACLLLAGRPLQLSAPDVLDISRANRATRQLYGLPGSDGDLVSTAELRRLLGALRLVQVGAAADNGFPRLNWDSPEDLAPITGDGHQHGSAGGRLIKDLKARGMLATRSDLDHRIGPFLHQGAKVHDHNPLPLPAGCCGGIRGGIIMPDDQGRIKKKKNKKRKKNKAAKPALLLRSSMPRTAPAGHRS